jgi:adenine-specific DNA-methyltransferase
MRYFGSKFSTLPQLAAIILARVPRGTFCDPFGGIGTVGAYFKTLGYRVWTGDLLLFAHCFQVARIHRDRWPAFRRVRDEIGLRTDESVVAALNRGWRRDGWFVQQYAKERGFFTLENARGVERVWENILAWQDAGLLSAEEYAVLTASLIHAMDQVANTAGTYYAYLKSWHRKARRPFRMELLRPAPGSHSGTCHLGPAHTLVTKREFDVLYLDPPYNERSYAHYYHLPETVARGVRPRIAGLSGIPVRGLERSAFNDPKNAAAALCTLLATARFKWLALHYADDGLVSRQQLREILAEHGRFEEFVLQSRGYTTKNMARQVSHRLYLLKRG